MEPDVELSICIATFNRARFIGETLDSIFSQSAAGVEVVVLDGGSTDNTIEVMSMYQQRYPSLRYIRQQVNLGVDRDFDSAVSSARGRYCWLMSDDDLIRPGGVLAVLCALRGDHDLIIANSEVRNGDLSSLLQTRRLATAVDREYQSSEMDRLFVDVGDYLTFIGCVIIRRTLWMERERERYFGSLFIHVGVIFQKPLPCSALVIATPLVSIRYGNAMWRPRQFEIWMLMWPSLVWDLPAVSTDAKRAVCRRAPWRMPGSLLLYRGRGAYSIIQYRELIRPRVKHAWERLVPLLIALIPGRAVNLLGLIYYHFAPGEKGMGLLDMRNSPFHYRNEKTPGRRVGRG